jgi:FAD/FMN-containing dehydrogenase
VNDLCHAIIDSLLLPSALVMLNPLACEDMNDGSSQCKLALWSEGFAETVMRHVRDAQALAERFGLATESLEDNLHTRFWEKVGDFPLSPNRIVFRLTVPRSLAAAAMKTVESREADRFRPRIIADVMAGTVWISAPATDLSASQFPKLIDYASQQRGHAIMLTAPREFKECVDVWGPPPPTLALMRKIKAQFDPDGLLNPGRYVGGI